MIDVRTLASGLSRVESLTWMPSVSSTNTIGRRVIDECIENEIILPFSVVVAGEQMSGRGRESREWHSPFGRGIYSTVLLSRAKEEVSLLPLEIAIAVAGFLSEVYGIDARIKWPNDIVANGKKLAGILLEARTHEETTFIAIGIGINVLPINNDATPLAGSIAELSKMESIDIDSATRAFVEFLDRDGLAFNRESIVDKWRALSALTKGDRVQCRVGDSEVSGLWEGIDDDGRALIRSGARQLTIAAGDIIAQ